jgi:hypothetical protein
MRIARLMCLSLPLLLAVPSHAAEPRPACALLAQADLVPLLGAGHDAPVDFGETSCRAESARPGRGVILSVMEGSAAETSAWMTSVQQLNLDFRGSEVTVAPETALGANAFSILEKGASPREMEIYVAKGGRALALNANFGTGAALTKADLDRLRQLAKAMLTKLP